ncbi:hypothetical protein WA026_020145 [Henosepilachna vigintioctopunctata]|uniref:Cell growth-regulating nucleolar protein n=1 Tax=Henosepilachna vigintioctopunctata TaxID=420089 RepID=A0AAW1UCQ2_9CUCU
MVVFTCNHCGESLQKPKVEKHYSFQCRRGKFLTCVDCLKDFSGEEYTGHVKCLTEEERYAAKGAFKNGNVKKGELKQEMWSDTIKSILDEDSNLNYKCKNLLNHIAGFNNVPRKKQKFINFMKSTMGGRVDNSTIEEVWNIIEEHKKNTSNPPVEEAMKTDLLKRKVDENRNTQNEKDSKKQKLDLETEENKSEESNVDSTKFNFKDEILKVLNKKESISITKLEKKILKKFSTNTQTVDIEKFKKKFAKKLKKIPNVSCEDEKIILNKL